MTHNHKSGPIAQVKMLVAKRKQIKMKQEEVANRLGISQQHLCEYERGWHIPNAATFANWLQILGYEIVEKEESWSSTVPEISRIKYNIVETDGLKMTVSLP